ncbi:MAG TPA: magnesium/cobalt transporter CorA [Smithella sp.]|nr:magnesium/cobalt transporter CorA [Smithella sp.]
MTSKYHKRSRKTGLAPGSLVHIGSPYAEKSKITLMQYNEGFFEAKDLESLKDFQADKDKEIITWLNVDGLTDIQLFEEIGRIFGLHPLVLEDILNTAQRPKMEDYGDYLYLVARNFHDQENGSLLSEQVSIILGKNFILSFREKESDLFKSIREKISQNKGRIRKENTDYLAHALLDNIVDNYFVILENLEEKIEALEDDLIRQPDSSSLQAIHMLKRKLILLGKSLWPLREAISALERSDSALINKTTVVYFKDIYDHTIAIIDTVETFKDMLSGILDVYLDTVSNRLNEVMKILTVIATIFMPLTFIAGIYGMNFKYMPELDMRWGYFGILGVMLLVALFMVRYFRKKNWF